MSRAAQAPAAVDRPSAWKNAQVGRVAAPLRDQVLGIVRQAIMDFDLKPGQRLVERELIEHLGVSRSTVREVLGQLSAEGLVTIVPQKGAVVTIPTAEDATDLYEIRANLEGLAVRRFVERATDAQRVALRVAFDAFARASEDGPIAALVAKDELYRVLLEGASSAPIQQLLATAQARVRAMRVTSLSEPGRAAEAVKEMRLIVEAIEAGKAPQAAKLCTAHVRAAAKSGLRRLAQIESDLY